MKTRRTGWMAVLGVFAAGAVLAQQGGYSFDPDTRIYVVRPGDTLWDIAEGTLDDSFKWPRIWENNPDVANPHRIYPDDRLTIPVVSGERPVARAPEPAPEPAPAAPAPRVPQPEPEPEPVAALEDPSAAAAAIQDISAEVGRSRLEIETTPRRESGPRGIYARLGDEGVLETEEDRAELSILGGADNRRMYATGDEVYLSRGRDGDLQVGDRFAVYDVLGDVRHPDRGGVLGTWVKTLGILEVVRVHDESSEARVIYATDSIEREHRLRRQRERSKVVAPNWEGPERSGSIVLLQGRRVIAGAYEVAYVDLGKADGIEEGRMLQIQREQPARRDPLTRRDVRLPPIEMGLGVVLEVRDGTATMLIVASREDIRVGDRVVTAARPD